MTRGVLGAALLLALAGCRGSLDRDVLWEEDFDDECAGSACGWSPVYGESPIYTEIITGDRGFLLNGEVALSGPSGPNIGVVTSLEGAELRWTARCDTGSALTLDLSIAVGPGAEPSTIGIAFVPPSNWEPRATEAATPLATSLPRSIDRVLGVVLRKSGAGRCEIDHLALLSPL